MANNKVASCPHCHAPLKKFTLPDNTGWQESYHLACFNDDCPYFRRGWVWMFERFGVKSSYRHRVDPSTGVASPLPVWSREALKNRIIEDDASSGAKTHSSAAAGVIPDSGSG